MKPDNKNNILPLFFITGLLIGYLFGIWLKLALL